MKVSFEQVEDAFLAVGGEMDRDPDVLAWVDRETGRVHCSFGPWGDPDLDEQPPADLYDNEQRYAILPSQRELGLGSRLALEFADEHLPEEDADRVHDYFRGPGAYRRFGDLLDVRGLTEQWHAYSNEATRRALRDWCEEVGIELDDE